MSDTVIKTKQLTKKYGKQTVVNKVNLTVKKGRIYGLLGRNGAGKTTIMKMILGLTTTTSGNVEVFGKNIDGNEKRIYSRIGAIIETPGFYPNLTGTENLEIFAKLRGTASPNAVKHALEVVGLPYKDKKTFAKYSLGMKQRLGIAQAMLNNPRILILDEPTAGLDPKERVRFRNLISAFSKDRIVILSTHIVSDVEFIAEDIIMMKDGQILHFGKTQEITTEIDGQVWECTVPTSRAEQYSETLNISNLRNIENNCTVLRVISEQSPMENAIKVEPTLEDLYLFYFKGVNE